MSKEQVETEFDQTGRLLAVCARNSFCKPASFDPWREEQNSRALSLSRL